MNKTILVVDDNEVNIDVLVNLLSNYDVITVLDGKSALEITKEEDIDLILLDIMMPDMDGFEVCKKLKTSSKTKSIPIIFLSAKNSTQDIKEGFKLGGVDYITKPFNPDELLSRVSTHLELRDYQKYLEVRVNQEVEKNRQKEQMMFQQAKQAALGEQLMHIAHQWKQPLNTLSSINILNIAKLDAGVAMTEEEYIESYKESEELILYMSDTVDTFKDFYVPMDDNDYFFINDCVKKVISLIDATFNFESIEVSVVSNEDEKTFGNINEFSQVIFSILNNARNIFKIRKTPNPKISIIIDNKYISISDNGGGIESEFLEKIFSPFISTNNSSGIGLYISKNIVEKYSGLISASNEEEGAKFTIEFLTWIN